MNELAKEIRKMMIDAEVTGGQIARDLNVSRAFIWQVIHGERRNPRVRQAVERAVGRRIWGDGAADGRR